MTGFWKGFVEKRPTREKMNKATWFARSVVAPLATSFQRAPAFHAFHTTAACMKQRFMGEVISNAMDKSGKDPFYGAFKACLKDKDDAFRNEYYLFVAIIFFFSTPTSQKKSESKLLLAILQW